MRIVTLALAGLFSAALAAQAPAAKTEKKAPAPAPKADTKPAPAPASAGFVGNKDSKVYHKADCKMAGKMKAANKVTFASKAEAEKAGYTPCKVCKADA
jgi:DNA-entry nuclease